MTQKFSVHCYLLFLLIFNSVVSAASDLPKDSGGQTSNLAFLNTYSSETEVLNARFQYFEDVNSVLSLDDVLLIEQEQWSSINKEGAKFGFSASTFWIRLSVKNEMPDNAKALIALEYPLLDFVNFYQLQGDQVIRTLETGDMRPFSNRDIETPNILYRLSQRPDQEDVIYIRVQSEGSVVFPLQIWHEKTYFETHAKAGLIHVFYFGAMFIVVFLNIAIFMMLRERIYLFYAVAIIGYIFFFASTRGFTSQILFPESPFITSQIMLSTMPLLAVFSILFTREFLQSKKCTPRLDIVLKGMAWLEVINLLLSFVLEYNLSIRLSALLGIPFFLLLLVSGPIVWRTGNKAGAVFTLAWFALTVGIFVSLLRFAGLMPDNFITEFGMQIGSGVEAVILMVALAYRIYHEREAKILAQNTSIQQAKEKRQSQEALVKAMLHDPVTKLPNRAMFEMAFNERIAANPNGDYMVLLVRIESYLEISRTLGLATGESLLKSISNYFSKEIARLTGVMPIEQSNDESLLLGNFSGDTFGVLLDRQEVMANSTPHFGFIEELRKPFRFESLDLDLNPKFGAARYPMHGVNAETLIRNAIVSIETNNNSLGISFYSKEQDIYNESRLTLMSELRHDLSNDIPQLFYQPKLSSETMKPVGMEALIRWNHSKLGFIPPDEFIPLAEETGLIHLLTRWVIKRALSDFLVFQEQGYEGDISINISVKNLDEPDLPTFIADILKEYKIDSSKVIFELTETAVMEDPEPGIIALKALTDLGVNLSIDDFGSGYSSLSYLKRLPASEIKLDRSLITDLIESESDRVIVQTSIDMAHNLGYDLVAEGVENKEVLDLLSSMRCDKMQGYHLSRPLSREDMQQWLADYKSGAVSKKDMDS